MCKWRNVFLSVLVACAGALQGLGAAAAPADAALPERANGTFVQKKTLADVDVTIVSTGTFRFEACSRRADCIAGLPLLQLVGFFPGFLLGPWAYVFQGVAHSSAMYYVCAETDVHVYSHTWKKPATSKRP